MKLFRLVVPGIVAVVAAVVGGVLPANAATDPTAGLGLAFDGQFGSLDIGPGNTWGYESDSYANCSTNPNDAKLDYLTPSAMSVANGVLTIQATQRSDGYWNTGLLTTGESCDTGGNGFTVQPGDFYVEHLRFPDGNTGAWPALWTWRNGNGELDAFEWHSDHDNLLELNNHVNGGGDYYSGSDIGSDKWLYVGVAIGATNDTWYEGTSLSDMTPMYSDNTGVGADFSSYPIVSLSVSSGKYHPAPDGAAPITMQVDSVQVYRP